MPTPSAKAALTSNTGHRRSRTVATLPPATPTRASGRVGPVRDERQGAVPAPAPLLAQAGRIAGHGGLPGGQGHRRRAGAVRPADDHRSAGPRGTGVQQGQTAPLPALAAAPIPSFGGDLH